MPTQGDVKSINGQTLGVAAMAAVTAEIIEGGDDPTADPQFLPRAGLPPEFTQSTVDSLALDVVFKTPAYSDRAVVLAALDFPNSQDMIELQGYQGNPTSPTLCTADVAVRTLKLSPGDVTVTFDKRDAAWRAVTLTDLGRTLSFTTAKAATLINKGNVRTSGFYKLGWTVQRATTSAAVGWKSRRQVTITNATTEDWEDELITVDAGDTAAWVTATKALANGDDVRVWIEGRELWRTLTNFNTKRTFIHFLISLSAGASATYDIVYGNASATFAKTLSTKAATRQTYAAPDLEGYNGTATSGAIGSMTDSGATWETNRWSGGFISFTSGTGSVRTRRILSNTGTVITLNRNVSTAPAAGTTYVIWKSGIFVDGGFTMAKTANTVQDTAHSRKWGVNQLAGATWVNISGGSTPGTMTVKSNTSDTLTFTTSFSVQPPINDQFTLERQGIWSYMVDQTLTETVHRGVYRENKYFSAPTRIWPNGNTPAGWQIETRLPNEDRYGVYPPYDIGALGGHSKNYWPVIRAYRRIMTDGKLTGQGVGDGFSLYSAVGFQGWYFDYNWRNINGNGQAAFSCMDVGGQDWQDLVTNTATVAALTVVAAQHVDLSAYDYPTRLYMGVLPLDGVACAGGSGDQVDLRNNTVFEVYHYLTSFGSLASSIYALGAEVECYELYVLLRIGGGREAERIPPFEEMVIGGSGHRVMLPATNELWIATDPAPGVPLFGVYDSAYVLQYVAAWAARIYHHIKNTDGSDLPVQSMEFSPIPPAISMVTNGYFGSNITGWAALTPSAGVTATMAWAATPDAGDGIGTGCMDINITAAPAGAWNVYTTWPQIAIVPGHNYPIGFAYRATNVGSSLSVQLVATWQSTLGGDPTMILGGAPAAINTWYYDADDEVAFKLEPGLVSAYVSSQTVDIQLLIQGTGSFSGHIYIDQVTLGVANIHATQSVPGTAYLKASWQEGYL